MRLSLFMVGLAASTLWLGSAAQGQALEPGGEADVAATPASTPGAVPDVVRLHDGSLWRGTLVESVVGSHVVLITHRGEERRFEASQVVYAGPVADAPAAAQTPAIAAPTSAAAASESQSPAVAPGAQAAATAATAPLASPNSPSATGAPGELKLSLRTHPSVTFYTDEGAGFEPVCVGQCEVSVQPGPRRFALGVADRSMLEVPDSYDFQNDDTVIGSYHSRRGARITGGVILGVLTPASFALLGVAVRDMKGAQDGCEESRAVGCSASKGAVVASAVGAALSAVVGLTLAFREDSVSIETAKTSQKGRDAHSPTAVAGTPEEGLEPDEQALRHLFPHVLGCWNGPWNPTKVRASVGADGSVEGVDVHADGASRQVRRCIEDVVRERAEFEPGAAREARHTFD